MPKRILLVDDEPDIIKLLTGRLESEGFEVDAVPSGKDAFLRVKENTPDLILLDVMMPEPNGLEVSRTLKDDPKYKNIPIILLTAKSTDDDKFWGREAGADAYITKPYDTAELLTKINTLIKGGSHGK